MKKLLLAAVVAGAMFTNASAQTAPATPMPQMSKADKDAAKAKKEADLVEAFTKAGVTADEQTKCRAAMDASNDKARPIKTDATLSDDDKKAKLEAIYKERNDALKAIMGDAKYKIFKATQKAQKEAAPAMGQ